MSADRLLPQILAIHQDICKLPAGEHLCQVRQRFLIFKQELSQAISEGSVTDEDLKAISPYVHHISVIARAASDLQTTASNDWRQSLSAAVPGCGANVVDEQTNETNYDPWRQWFSDHLSHPYYDNRQRDGLLRQVKGMTPQKMATWFINVRRRSGWSEFSKRYAEGKQEEIVAILEAIDNPDPFTSGHVDPGARALVTKIRDYLTLESKRTVIMPWLANLLEDYKKGQTNGAFNKQVSESAAPHSPSSSLSSLSPLSSIDSIDLASRSPTPTRALSPGGNRSGHKRKASDSTQEHEEDNTTARTSPSKRARSSTSRAPAFPPAALSAEPACAPETPVRGQTKAQHAEALRNGTELCNVSEMQVDAMHVQMAGQHVSQAMMVSPYTGPTISTRSQFDAIAGYTTAVEQQPSYMLTPEMTYDTSNLAAVPAWHAAQPYMQQMTAQNSAILAWSPEAQWTHLSQGATPVAAYTSPMMHTPHIMHAQAPMCYPPAANTASKKRRYSEDAEMPSTPTYKRACMSQPSKETIYEMPQYETMLNAHVDPQIMQVMPQQSFGNVSNMSAPMQRSDAQPTFQYMDYYAAVPQIALAGPGAYINYPQYFSQAQC